MGYDQILKVISMRYDYGGTWEVRSFPSGTNLVELSPRPLDAPWFNIHTPFAGNYGFGIRHQMAQSIANYLNGGLVPQWLEDMDRVGYCELMGTDGSLVTVIGPMRDLDPPHCKWDQREDEDVKLARKDMMDYLCREVPCLRGECGG